MAGQPNTLKRERCFVQAAGHRLLVERLAPAATASPTLVFLHEGLGSIDQWRDFPAQLCTDCGLPGLVYDRWGFGGSDPLDGPRSPEYLYQEATESLPEVLDRCAVREPAVLIGHSDGGTIALLFAATYPDRVRALVTEAAHVFVEEITLVGIRAAKALYDTTDLPRHLARYHGAKVDSTFSGWCDTWLRADFRAWTMTAELARVVCPALVIQGEEDEYGTPAQVETIARGVSGPVEILLIPGCGHVPHQQARDIVRAAMSRFIARWTG